jgi:hypothetical protein
MVWYLVGINKGLSGKAALVLCMIYILFVLQQILLLF